MAYLLGFDLSTQSCSSVLFDSQTQSVVSDLSVNFGLELPEYKAPSGFFKGSEKGEVFSDPLMWLDALDLLFSKMQTASWPLDQVVGIAGSGQQHGSVYLNDKFTKVVAELSISNSLSAQLKNCLSRPVSPIWMDGSTSQQCAEIAKSVGGNIEVCNRTGSIMTERFTGAQIRRFQEKEPEAYKATERIHLVSSFFASVLAGCNAPIDSGDGAGMNLLNLQNLDWDSQMANATADSLLGKLPKVADSSNLISTVSSYFVEKYGLNSNCEVYPWSGDNPCSLVGMGATQPGKWVISLGTSYTLFAAMHEPKTDPNGFGHVFGNPLGDYMSLICFKNGSLAREKICCDQGGDWSQFGNDYLEETVPGNTGKLLLPFYESEITPHLPEPSLLTNGWSKKDEDSSILVRAFTEGLILNMRCQSEWIGDLPAEILITGGGSKSAQLCQIVADVFNVPVRRLEQSNSAALGAAIMAAVATNNLLLDKPDFIEGTQPSGDITLPNASAVEVYQELLPEFKSLLQT